MNSNDLRDYANFLLCCAASGLNVDGERITWALRITGDLNG